MGAKTHKPSVPGSHEATFSLATPVGISHQWCASKIVSPPAAEGLSTVGLCSDCFLYLLRPLLAASLRQEGCCLGAYAQAEQQKQASFFLVLV
jgi:hypothetical protein